MYGAFRDSNDFLYDPYCTYRTTINLQLCLIMLIEELELNIDGMVVIHNDNIIKKDNYQNLILNENDRLELLNFVSGG